MGRLTGFALLSPERRKAVASAGGREAHRLGNAPEFESGSERARLAGRKGGEARARKRREQSNSNGTEHT